MSEFRSSDLMGYFENYHLVHELALNENVES